MYYGIFLLTIFLTACAETPDVQHTRGQNDATEPPPGISRMRDKLLFRPCDAGMCFYDTAGSTPYWLKGGRFYSSEILARQKRYKAWIERKRRSLIGTSVRIVFVSLPAERSWTGSSLVLPARPSETGRLDIDTVAIPYYQSVFELLVEAEAFAHDCEEAYTARDVTLASFCAASRSVWQNETHTVTLLNKSALQHLDPAFKLRVVMLHRAFLESAAYGKAIDAVFRQVSDNGKIDIERDGIDPDQIRVDLAETMEAADLKLTGALSEVQWAAEAYRSRIGTEQK